jgi:sRNA-binding carbon storage regulator CsrA
VVKLGIQAPKDIPHIAWMYEEIQRENQEALTKKEDHQSPPSLNENQAPQNPTLRPGNQEMNQQL